MILKMISLLNVLNYPIVRHLLAGSCIVALLWVFSIAPLQKQNEKLQANIKQVTEKQQELIKELSLRDTYKIENKVDGVKIKKGGEIRMYPSSTLDMDAANIKTEQDTITNYRKHWWQLWKKRKNNNK